MKKVVKIVLLIVVTLGMMVMIDFLSIKLLKRPLLARETSYRNLNREYDSLFYKAYYCKESNELYVVKKNQDFSCDKENQKFIIVDNSEACDQALEEIYYDDKYIYYLPCIKSDYIFIKFDDKDELYSLKYVLTHELLTIDELIDGGLEIIKENINENGDVNE